MSFFSLSHSWGMWYGVQIHLTVAVTAPSQWQYLVILTHLIWRTCHRVSVYHAPTPSLSDSILSSAQTLTEIMSLIYSVRQPQRESERDSLCSRVPESSYWDELSALRHKPDMWSVLSQCWLCRWKYCFPISSCYVFIKFAVFNWTYCNILWVYIHSFTKRIQ